MWLWVCLLDECFGGFGCSCVCAFLFSWFCLLSCLVWLITGCFGFGRVLGRVGGWRACFWPVLVCFFLFGGGVSCVGWCRAGPWCAPLGGLLGCWVVVVRVCAWACGRVCAWARVRVCAWACGRGCLGVGVVVWVWGVVVVGGVLLVWLRDGVASGGVSVGFDVGERVFMLGGVSVIVSGSVSAVSGPVSVSGSVVLVLPGAGVGVSGSFFGVVVCVLCVVRVFGVSWCSLVLRRWVWVAGVVGVEVGVLLGSVPVLGSVSVSVSGSSSSSPSPVSGGSVSVCSLVGGGRVGAGFGARVRDWGVRVGVGGGVVSGGGVVVGWWQRVVGRVGGLVSGVGVKGGLVLAGLVGVVVLVSVLVLVG